MVLRFAAAIAASTLLAGFVAAPKVSDYFQVQLAKTVADTLVFGWKAMAAPVSVLVPTPVQPTQEVNRSLKGNRQVPLHPLDATTVPQPPAQTPAQKSNYIQLRLT
jgi:hypothetical protein